MGEMTRPVKEKFCSCSKPSALSTEQWLTRAALHLATQRKNLGIHTSTLNTLQAEFQLWCEEKSMCGFKSDEQVGIFDVQENY